MADKFKTTQSRSGGKITSTSIKGSEAGKDAKYQTDQDEADWQEYKVAKRLSFAAQRKEHEGDFQSWRKSRAEATEARKKNRDQ